MAATSCIINVEVGLQLKVNVRHWFRFKGLRVICENDKQWLIQGVFLIIRGLNLASAVSCLKGL